jgi:hypothetical protein
MKNPFLKNLEEQELIREATRKGISVDELKSLNSQPVEPFDLESLINPVKDYSQKTELGPMVASLDSGMMRVPQIEQIKRTPVKRTEPIQEEIQAPEVNKTEVIKEYFKKKNGLDKYSDEARQSIIDQNKKDASGPNWLAALAGLGGTLQGKDALASGMKVLDLQNNQRQSKLDEFDSGRKQSIEKMKIDKELEASDPNAPQSEAFRKIIEANFPRIAEAYGDSWKNVTAQDRDLIFEPIKLKESIEARKEQARLLSQEKEQVRQDRMNQKALEAEKLNVTQSKQRGLYEIGQKAEQQYLNAVKDKSEYNPTNSGQWIDNSQWAPNLIKNDKAIEAQAAMSAWVEAFLRDASGAAIPQGERLDYAKDFFPQPGDSEQTVKNKQELRRQKMNNAKVGSGLPSDSNQQSAPSNDIESKIESFMKKNGISDRNEAIKILKEAGKI